MKNETEKPRLAPTDSNPVVAICIWERPDGTAVDAGAKPALGEDGPMVIFEAEGIGLLTLLPFADADVASGEIMVLRRLERGAARVDQDALVALAGHAWQVIDALARRMAAGLTAAGADDKNGADFRALVDWIQSRTTTGGKAHECTPPAQ